MIEINDGDDGWVMLLLGCHLLRDMVEQGSHVSSRDGRIIVAVIQDEEWLATQLAAVPALNAEILKTLVEESQQRPVTTSNHNTFVSLIVHHTDFTHDHEN